MTSWRRPLTDEHGTALFAAVVGMLLLVIFALSVAALSDLETRIGANYKAAQQAVDLAEAGLEHGRQMVSAAAAAGNFNAFIANATSRQLGISSSGLALGPGVYWVRVDNDCATPSGFSGSPSFVPASIQDNGGSCSDTTDTNKTVVLTAWAQTQDGSGRVIGRARVRAYYSVSNAWSHVCYNGNNQFCTDDWAGGCNNNPCVDPSDSDSTNGPAKGQLPVPNDIRCGTTGIPAADIPADVLASGAIGLTTPCVIYPYYTWALHQAAPTRQHCYTVIGSGTGYGTDNCSPSSPGTLAYDATNPTCTTAATASKCHGAVFFGKGTSASNLAQSADISLGTNNSDDAGCMGSQKDRSTDNCYNSTISADSSVVVYVLGKITIKNNVGVNGTVVLHGNGVAGGGSNTDFGLTGTVQLATHPCVAGSPAPSPGCGYPLAILAYNPNEAVPTTSTGQTIVLDLSDSTAIIHGLVYTGGTANFNPVTIDGALMGWDVNVNNAATRMTYNSTYGNAAPPPAFTTPPPSAGGGTVVMSRPTWVLCQYYGDDYNGPTPCQ
jgi:Tfp pilus assembly protein PilX